MRRTLLPVLACVAAAACTSRASVDLRSPGQWPTSCLQPNAICSAGAQGVGDGGPLLEASFAVPETIAFDSTGNLFIADEFDEVIRRVDAATGLIAPYAGTGYQGDPAPGTLATLANVERPANLTVCPDGWLMFDQDRGSTVWGVDPATGKIEVVTGDPSTTGDAADDVPADQATFRFGEDISGLSCGPDDVLMIADTANFVIRALVRGANPVSIGGVTVQPGHVRIIAGVPELEATGADGPDARASALGYPAHAISLGDGRVVFADVGTSRLRLVTATGAIRSLIDPTGACCGNDGDGGPAVDADAYGFEGLAWNGGDQLFLPASGTVRMLNIGTSGTTTFAGVTVPAGYIDQIAGAFDGRSLHWPLGDGGAALGQPIDDYPSIPVLSPTGELWFTEPDTGLIRKIDAAGIMSVTGGFAGAAADTFLPRPDQIVATPDGGLVLTAENGHLWRLAPGATAFTSIAGDGTPTPGPDALAATSGGMAPIAIAAGPDGSLYLFDDYNHSLRVIDRRGKIRTLCQNDYFGGEGDGGPLSDAFVGGVHTAYFDGGILYWEQDYTIRAANLSGASVTLAGTTIAAGDVDTIAGYPDNGSETTDVPAAQAHFYFPSRGGGLFVLDGKLWIDDGGHGQLRTLDLRTGIVHVVNDGSDDVNGITPLSHAYIDGSTGIAMHEGWIYWTASGDRVWRARLPDGPMEVVAGAGFGDTGDGASALLAQIDDAGSLAITPDGVVWVTDRGHRVRRIQPGGLR